MRKLICCLLLMVVLSVEQVATSEITIKDNGYANLVVAIKDSIPEKEGEILVNKIKERFTAASKFLYEATKHRAYFRDIKILIPTAWTRFGKQVQRAPDTWSYESADVHVYNTTAKYQYPKTSQSGGCGDRGNHIAVSAGFIVDADGGHASRFGPPYKTVVHEFAHLRYGVFDEFGIYGHSKYTPFYLDDKRIRLTACDRPSIQGKMFDNTNGGPCKIVEKTGLPDANCRFKIDRQASKSVSSLMSHHILPTVNFFCEHDNKNGRLHNKYAPNQQNELCHGKSTWTVIEENEDFRNNKNPPRNGINTAPTFTLVAVQNTRAVLVLDVSGSMDQDDAIEQLKQSTARWILNDFIANNSLGIVTFNENAKVILPLTKIVTKPHRDQAVGVVRTLTAGGGTCIHKGVHEALTLLKNGGGTDGGMIVLMTDGQNACGDIIQLLPVLRAAKVRVFTIAMTADADKSLDKLATGTNGKSYTANPKKDGLSALYAAFFDITKFMYRRREQSRIKIYERDHHAKSDPELRGHFQIEERLSDAIDIRYLSTNGNMRQIVMRRPSGKETICKPGGKIEHRYSSLDVASGEVGLTEDEIKFDDVTCTWSNNLVYLRYLRSAKGHREVGQWKYGIGLVNPRQKTTITVIVSAGQNGAQSEDIISATSRIHAHPSGVSKKHPIVILTAQVMYGEFPVAGAEVFADVAAPDSNIPIRIALLDNGNGMPDVTKNDGIYSAYFTEMTVVGRYPVKIIVRGITGKTHAIIGFSPPGGSDIPLPKKPLKPFERQINGGSIHVIERFDKRDSDKVFPPSKPVDIQLNSLNGSLASLQWTAPGGARNKGTVSSYVIKASLNRNDLIDSFVTDKNIVKFTLNPTKPAPSGQLQKAQATVLQLPKAGQVVYLAVQAVNSQGKKGPFSDIVNSQPNKQSPGKPGGGRKQKYNISVDMKMKITVEKSADTNKTEITDIEPQD